MLLNWFVVVVVVVIVNFKYLCIFQFCKEAKQEIYGRLLEAYNNFVNTTTS